MAINVRGPKTPKISVTQGDQGVAAIIVRTGGGSTGGSGLGSIPGVNVGNVQNNQTIFYNSATGTFDARFVNLRYDSLDNYVESLFAGSGITIPNPTGHAQQPVISLTPSGVVAGTYGSNVSIPIIVVDTFGRVNTISNLAITSNILPLSSNTGIYFNKETGVFYLGQNVDTTSNVTFNDVSINNLSATNSITAQSVAANVWSGIYTANVVETSGNLYLTNARVRTALSVNDQGGDGSLTYNNANGQFTYIGPSSAEVRAHLSSTDNGGDGAFSYDQANGNFIYTGPSPLEARAHLSSVDTGGDGSFNYNNTTGVFTYTGPSPTEARAHLAGSGGVYYNNANGIFSIGQNVDTTSNVTFNDVTVSGKLYSNDITFNDITVSGNLTVVGTTTSINTEELNIADNKIVLNSDLFGSPSQSAGITINRGVQANVELLWNESLDVWTFTNDGGVYYLVPTSTTDLIEGTNLYYTNARARASVSINDQGGDGSITYNAANGQFTYIGPSPTEVRAHLNTSTGLFYNNANGVFHLRDTAVTPNVYGGSTKIPVITIDQQGRITNAANIDVAGVTNFTAVGNTFTIFTADGNTFSSSIQQDSIVLARDTTGPYVANLIASTGVSIFNLGDENSVPTISIGQNVYSSQAVVFANVAAHTFTGNLYGNNITTTNKISANSLTVTNDITAQTITGTDKVNANSLSVTNDITAQSVSANVWSGIYTANVIETSGNLYFTNARVRTSLSVNDQGGDGSFTYNNANGQFTYIGPSPLEARAHLSATDAGGDGSFSYNNTTGVFTYTGPSPTEVRAHLAGSNGVYYNNANGVFNIGQNVDVTSNVTFNNVIVNGALFSNDITADTITVKGNLIVDGATTTVNTEQINLADNKILLNSNHIGVPSQDGGIIINRGNQANVDFIWNETKDIWEFTNDGTTYWPVPTSTTDLKEGANLYYTTARVLTDTDPTFNQANIARLQANTAFAQANLVFSSSNVKVGTVAGVNNTSISNVVLAAGIQQTGILNTSNVIEGSNLYYTTARVLVDTANAFNQANTARNLANAVYNHANLVYSSSNVKVGTVAGVNNTSISNVVLAAGIQQTGILNTSNVIEGSNLYYTTARVLVDTANAFNQANTARNLANAVYNHANLVYSSSNVKVGTVAGVNNTSISNVVLAAGVYQTGIFNTSNVQEGSNLYYTTARVLVDTANAFNQANTARNLANAVYDHANLVYSSSNVKVGTVAGVNNTSISNVVLAAGIQQTGILNTSNVIEGSSLYYTTARVLVDTANAFNQANTARNLANAVYDHANLVYSSSNVKVGTVAGVNNTSISNVVLAAGIQQTGILNTSNVIEGSNLYYTTARVLVDTANAFNQANTARNLANAVYNHANLVYSSSNVKVGTVAGVNNTSISNVVLAAGIQQTGILNTSNVIEGSNLYYTTARVLVDTANAFNQANTARNLANAVYNQANLVYDSSNVKVGTVAGVNATSISNVVLSAGIRQTGILNTSNVIEGSNLYYTTARVLVDTANVFDQANTARNLANAVYNSSNVKVGTVAGVNNTSISNVVLAAGVQQTGILNTSNVIEGSNLYYTTARVLTDTAPTFERANAALAMANLVYGSSNVKVGTVAGVNNTSISNVVLAAGVQQTGILNTSNVVEGSNLYFTTQRARNSITANSGAYYNSTTGTISIGQNVDPTSNVIFNNMILTGNLNVQGNGIIFSANTLTVQDPLIQLGYGNPGNSVDIGFVGHYNDGTERHTGLFRDATDGKFKFFTNLTPVPNGTFVDTANSTFQLATVVATTFEGNLIGNVTGRVSTLDNFTTANLVEGTNLYYTTARVLTATGPTFERANAALAMANLVYSSSNVKVGTVAGVNATSISNVVLAAGIQQTGILNTSNVIEGSNLYYTTARVLVDTANAFNQANTARNLANAVYDQANLVYSSSNVKVGTVAGVNNTSISNVVLAAGIQQTGILNTSNVVEGINLYYTTARVLVDTANAFNQANTARNLANAVYNQANLVYDSSNVKVGTVAGVNATSISNVVLAAGVRQTGIFNTSNVIEGANLYYTTARVLVDTANAFNQANTARSLANVVYDSSNVKVGTVAGVNATSISNVVLAAGVQQTGIFNTSNVIEGSNLYYTTARVLIDTANAFNQANTARNLANAIYNSSNVKVDTVAGVNATSISNVVLAAGVQQTGILNTSNVIEGSNLYYTTARVLVDTANAFNQANTARNLANAVYNSSNVKVGTVAGVNATSISNVVLASGVQQTGILNTSNVIEGSNLYYTTARVLTDTGPTFERANAALAMANLVYGSSNVKVGTVAGVNNTSISNVVLAAGVQQTGILNTSNVIEGSNLYYTTARVLVDTANAFNQANTARNLANAVYNHANLVYSSSNVKVGTVAGVNNTSISNVVLAAGVQQTGIFNTSNVIEGSNLYYTTARVLTDTGPTFERANAALAMANLVYGSSNVKVGTVAGVNATSISNVVLAAGVQQTGILNTSNVIEGSNLYYTNSRVRATIFANSGVYYNSTTGTFGIGQNVDTTSNVTFNNVTVNGTLNSDDITAANVTVKGNLTVTGTVTTVNTEEINLADNKILLNSNFAGTPTENGGFIINRGNLANTEFIWNEFNDRWEFTNNGTVYYPVATNTTDLQEGANLYYTNARARLAISANSNILYNSTTGTISLDSNVLTTANVVESVSSLYYTNARVKAVVEGTTFSNVTIAGNVAAGNINITGRYFGDAGGITNVPYTAVVGLTTQNVTEVANLYFTNARSRAAISAGAGLVYNQSTGVIRVDPNTQGGGGGGADFAAVLIYSQP